MRNYFLVLAIMLLCVGCLNTEKTLKAFKAGDYDLASSHFKKAENKNEEKKVRLSFTLSEFCLECLGDTVKNYTHCCRWLNDVQGLTDKSDELPKKDIGIFERFGGAKHLFELSAMFDTSFFAYIRDINKKSAYWDYLGCFIEPQGFKKEAEDSIYALFTPNKFNDDYPAYDKLLEFEEFLRKVTPETNHNYETALLQHYLLYTWDGEVYSLEHYYTTNWFKQASSYDTIAKIIGADSVTFSTAKAMYAAEMNDSIEQEIIKILPSLFPREAGYLLTQKLIKADLDGKLYNEAIGTLDKVLSIKVTPQRVLPTADSKLLETKEIVKAKGDLKSGVKTWFPAEWRLPPGDVIRPLFGEKNKYVTVISDKLKSSFYIDSKGTSESGDVQEHIVSELSWVNQSEDRYYIYDKGRRVTYYMSTAATLYTEVSPPHIDKDGFKPDVRDIYIDEDRQVQFYSFNTTPAHFNVNIGNYYHGTDDGNYDIYVEDYSLDGSKKWTRLNVINTPFSERSPYFYDDTLFFSSNGYSGLGGYDVFFSVRTDTTSWTHWSKPVNLGKNINSSFDELNYKKTGKFDCFQSNRDGKFTVYESYNFEPNQNIILFSGVCVDTGRNPIKTVVEVFGIDRVTGAITPLAKDFSNEDGIYKIKAPNNIVQSYYILKFSDPSGLMIKMKSIKTLPVDNPGVIPTTVENLVKEMEKISISDIATKSSVQLVPLLSPGYSIHEFEDGSDSLYFDYKKAILRWESMKLLRFMVLIVMQQRRELLRSGNLKQEQKIVFDIFGYADKRGPDAFNYTLSRERAGNVKAFLLQRCKELYNCSFLKFNAYGEGETDDFDKRETEEGYQRNRVVFIITGGVTK